MDLRLDTDPTSACLRDADEPDGADRPAPGIGYTAAVPIDPHALALCRGLAYHQAVAERLREDPGVLAKARARVKGWLESGVVHRAYAGAWDRILAGEPDEVARTIVDPSQRGDDLRQTTPFAGAIGPRERWEIWARVKRDAERQ